jgi:hypothetical protein
MEADERPGGSCGRSRSSCCTARCRGR